jgi:nitric oxide synthase oxygenase domain/subunit
MKHKIKISQYDWIDDWYTTIEIDGRQLVSDGENTYNCLGEILEILGIEADIEFEYGREIRKIETKKMKLVEDLQ